jgi:hypothetical protein
MTSSSAAAGILRGSTAEVGRKLAGGDGSASASVTRMTLEAVMR